jgi:hypothetical protein
VRVHSSVRAIEYGAFRERCHLAMLILNDELEAIGKEAFRSCTNLHRIEIPHTVRKIGREAFRKCATLTTVTLGNGLEEIGMGAFFKCTSLQRILIPNNVKSIKGWAFRNCTELTDVTFGDGLEVIGEEAFARCESLQRIRIADSARTLAASLRDTSPAVSTTIPSHTSGGREDVTEAAPITTPLRATVLFQTNPITTDLGKMGRDSVHFSAGLKSPPEQLGTSQTSQNPRQGSNASPVSESVRTANPDMNLSALRPSNYPIARHNHVPVNDVDNTAEPTIFSVAHKVKPLVVQLALRFFHIT